MRNHGKSKTRVYNSWCGMKQRVNYIGHSMSKYYRLKGIKICKRWESFQNFYDDMGDPPANHSLDRIDSNGDYEPKNCRWATRLVQANNSSRCNYITFKGQTKTVTGWAKHLGINRVTLSNRINTYKWPIDKAFEVPVIEDHRCNLKGRKRIGPKL